MPAFSGIKLLYCYNKNARREILTFKFVTHILRHKLFLSGAAGRLDRVRPAGHQFQEPVLSFAQALSFSNPSTNFLKGLLPGKIYKPENGCINGFERDHICGAICWKNG